MTSPFDNPTLPGLDRQDLRSLLPARSTLGKAAAVAALELTVVTAFLARDAALVRAAFSALQGQPLLHAEDRPRLPWQPGWRRFTPVRTEGFLPQRAPEECDALTAPPTRSAADVQGGGLRRLRNGQVQRLADLQPGRNLDLWLTDRAAVIGSRSALVPDRRTGLLFSAATREGATPLLLHGLMDLARTHPGEALRLYAKAATHALAQVPLPDLRLIVHRPRAALPEALLAVLERVLQQPPSLQGACQVALALARLPLRQRSGIAYIDQPDDFLTDAPSAPVRAARALQVPGAMPTLDVLVLPGNAKTGSTAMRGPQLIQVVQPHLNERLTLKEVDSPKTLRDRTIWVTKGAIKSLGADGLAELRARGNRILLDGVDLVLPRDYIEDPDTVVACSYTALIFNQRRHPQFRSVLVPHHPDPRLPAPAERPHFSLAYFGTLAVTRIPEPLRPMLAVHQALDPQDARWMDALPATAAHYAIRDQMATKHVPKPFTKGFVAAQMRANILIAKNDSDAIYYLGPDYPYFVADARNDAAILATASRMREEFGGPVWRFGLDIMREVAARIEPKVIAEALWRAVRDA